MLLKTGANYKKVEIFFEKVYNVALTRQSNTNVAKFLENRAKFCKIYIKIKHILPNFVTFELIFQNLRITLATFERLRKVSAN